MARIFVIAGHGAGDSGAVGNGYTEAERVRVLAKKIKELGGNNVMLGDVNRDYYADNGISTLNIPMDYQIIELHMDSASPSAKGGHVIIESGFQPDTYDNALANFIGNVFPGRSNLIVGRNDLANPNRAAARGYSYRLVEFGFISNAGDVNTFNTRLTDIAKGVLNCFGITSTSGNKPNKPSTTPTSCKVVLKDNTHYGDESRWHLEPCGDDYFRLRNKKTGLYLDVTNGCTDNGTFIQAYKGNGSDAQMFKRVRKSHDEADYILWEPKIAPGKYLSVENNGVNGSGKTHLKLWEDEKSPKQKFWMKQATDGSGTYLIMHMYSIMYISVE